MLRIGKHRERKLELLRQRATLVRRIDADGQNLGVFGFEFIVVSSQTG